MVVSLTKSYYVLLRSYPRLSIGRFHQRRHPHFGARLGAFRFESPANNRVLVLVLNLPAAIRQRHVGLNLTGLQFKLAAQNLKRQITRRFRAGIEMLMKPALRRHDDRSRL